MNITIEQLQQILEAALMVAGRPLTLGQLQKLFDEPEQPSTAEIQTALQGIRERYLNSGIELCEVASGLQFQAKTELSPWLCRLWEERPPRYSRALLETLALIAYRQPITRAEVEEIRGVSVSSHIIKTLQEREWIRVIGYRDVPGKPALYGTTKSFLDHFNLKSLDELPTLAELKDLDVQEAKLQVQLELTDATVEHPQEGEYSSELTVEAPSHEATDEAQLPQEEENSPELIVENPSHELTDAEAQQSQEENSPEHSVNNPPHELSDSETQQPEEETSSELILEKPSHE